MKAELAKIKNEVKEINKKLSVTHLFLLKEVGHSKKSNLGISIPFSHKYSFPNLKNKNSFALQGIKIEKEIQKSFAKQEKEQEKED